MFKSTNSEYFEEPKQFHHPFGMIVSGNEYQMKESQNIKGLFV